LLSLHALSRRLPVAIAAIITSGVALRVALHWPWNTYGALQLPLIAEAACAICITMATVNPFGEVERASGHRLPLLRLSTLLTLLTVATATLTTATVGAHVAGGVLELLRNLVGLTGLGLLAAAVLGGSLGWTAPTAYLILGLYALYTRWHGPA